MVFFKQLVDGNLSAGHTEHAETVCERLSQAGASTVSALD